MTPRVGYSFLTARTACWAIPFGFQDSRASNDFFSGGTTGNSAIAGMRSRINDAQSRSSSSTESRSTPGMESTGCRCFVPSTTKIG